MRRLGLLAGVGSLAAASGVSAASAEGDWLGDLVAREHLSGSWWGARSELEERGVSLAAVYTLDVLSNLSGGERRGTSAPGNLDLQLTAELEPLLGWPGARVFLYGLGNHGGDPSDEAGDVQLTSSIEAFDTWKLFEAWLEQDLFEGRLSVRAGLYDLSSEFDVIPVASLFLNGSHGTGSDLGSSGRNGPSIFPTTSVAARVEVKARDALYARVVVADGVPGDPDDPRGTEVHFRSGDGVLVAGELGWNGLASGAPSPERPSGKYALGAWGYTGDFDDLVRVDGSGDPLERSGSWGVYALFEQPVTSEPGDPGQGLSVFARLGLADRHTAPLDAYVGGGAVYRGPIPGRDRDQLGLGVAAAHLSRDFRRSRAQAGALPEAWEVTLELSYLARVTGWLSLQPDLQYVIDPGSRPGLANALVVGARLVISL